MKYQHPPLKPLLDYPSVALRERIQAERQIAQATIRALLAAGYSLRVHSGEEWESQRIREPGRRSERHLMQALFNLDEAWLMTKRIEGKEIVKGWVRFVFGNDGWDVISDHTMDLEEALKATEAVIEKWEKKFS